MRPCLQKNKTQRKCYTIVTKSSQSSREWQPCFASYGEGHQRFCEPTIKPSRYLGVGIQPSKEMLTSLGSKVRQRTVFLWT